MVRPALALLGLLLATAAAPAGVGAAEPKAAAVRAFERGARELEFGRIDEAATAFAAAIALDAVESSQPVARPSGMNFEPYLPHLALGVARCEGGDLPGAAASWAESDRQGVARATRGAARLLTRREECSARHGGSGSAEWRAATSPAPGAGAQHLEPAEPAPAVENRPQAESVPALPAHAAGETDAPEPPAGSTGLAESAAAPGAAVAEPLPPELLRAAQELFDGRPARAYEILEGFSAARPRARAQAHLVRSAASFDLARLGRDSEAWLSRARRERAAAARAAPALVPDRRFFAPAFVEFFAGGADPAPLPDLLAR